MAHRVQQLRICHPSKRPLAQRALTDGSSSVLLATLAAVSTFAPAILSAESPIGVGCIGLGTRGTPKCSTDEAFIETATFLMSLKAQQERRMVRWDAAREGIV